MKGKERSEMRPQAILMVFLGFLCYSGTCVVAFEETEALRRMEMPFEVRVTGEDSDSQAVAECLEVTLIREDGELPMVRYGRTLCVTPVGRVALFEAADLGSTGEVTTTLIDVDSGSWLRIMDQPEIEKRGVDEDIWVWEKRLNDVRDHLVSVETSTRLFDPFDAEVTDEARSVLWEDLQKSDPDLAEVVGFLLEALGACRHPWCEGLTHGVEDWVYGGEPMESPEVTVRRTGNILLENPDEHEISDFEKDFGKWGDSFPDPPKLN